MSEPSRKAGFTLVEVLAAIVVASLVLTALSQAFQTARIGTKIPSEIVAAASVAQSVALTLRPDAFPEAGRIGLSDYERRTGSVRIDPRRADIAPPVLADNRPSSSAPHQTLRRISVLVTTPSGRRVAFDTIRLVDAAP